MSPIWKTLPQKLEAYACQMLSILIDGLFILAWLLFQHGVKWIFAIIAAYFGAQNAVDGFEYWLILTGHVLMSGSTLLVICFFLVTDLCKLGLYCLDDIGNVAKEIRAKAYQRLRERAAQNARQQALTNPDEISN